jgi:hypothetical protein
MARPFLIQPITDDSAIGGQIIDGSVAFNASLAKQHLRYTPSSDGNRYKFTISCWVKRTLATTGSAIMGVWVNNSDRMVLRFFDDGRLNLQYTNNATTKGEYKDVTAWYHIVVAVDTTLASAADRVKIYVNSVFQELSAQDFAQNQETRMLDNVAHYIGARVSGTDGNSPESWFDGYMTQFYIIDNQQLSPTDFGYTESQTGTWRPKKYKGTFNTHSLYLPLDGSDKLGKDKSGNNNDWSSYNIEATISLDKATGGFPVLNTNNSGTIAHPGVRPDPFGSNCILAIPFQFGLEAVDRSNEINSSSTTKTITASGVGGSLPNYNFYGSSSTFDGTNDYMSVADSDDFHFGNGDFCIECWVKPNSVSGSRRIYSQTESDGTPDASLIFRTDNTKLNFYFQVASGGDRIYLNSGVKDLVQSKWYHVAVTREGSTFRTFINGEIDQTGTYAGTMPNISDPPQIGRRENNSEFWSGEMQDLRIYKGAAKYTSNFVPAATNPHIVADTPSGSAVTRKFKPNPSGSGWFDGSNGTQMQLADHADLELGSETNWTVEFYAYFIENPTDYDVMIGKGTGSGSYEYFIECFANRTIQFMYSNDGSTTWTGQHAITPDMGRKTWFHIAIVRDGSSLKSYVNGKQYFSGTAGNIYAGSGVLNIGGYSGASAQDPPVIMSNVRIVKGTSVYTSNFTPSKKPLDAITNTKLLCLQSTDNLTKAAVAPTTITTAGGAYPSNINPFDNDTIGQESNYATLNSYDGYAYNSTFTEHGTKVSIPASNTYGLARSTIAATKGKYYWEVTYTTPGGNGNYLYVGVGCIGRSTPYYFVRGQDGEKGSNYGNSGGTNLRFGVNDVIGVYLDLDNAKWYCAVNGKFQDAGNGVGNPEVGTGYVHNNLRIPYYTVGTSATQYGDTDDGLGAYFGNATGGAAQAFHVNFGQKPFKYPPPKGYKTLSRNNLPRPSIVRPEKHFNTLLYTGNNSTNVIRGLDFKPDFIWFKSRTSTSWHAFFDVVRGRAKGLSSNVNNTEYTSGSTQDLVSFDDNGFTCGTLYSWGSVNGNSNSIVAWCWKAGGAAVTNNDGSVASQVSANVEAGFSIVTYAGSGVRTIGHGLSKRPEMIIMKGRDVSDQWTIGHAYMNNATSPWNYGLSFGNGTIQNNANFWNDTYPTDTVFTRGSWNAGQEMVSYCFHSVEGYSKVGWYIANANANGPYVHCGFRPAFVIVKNEDNSGEEWVAYDNKRVTPTVNNVGSPNGATAYMGHNYAEGDGNAGTGGNSRNVSFFSTGFKITDTGNPLNKGSDEGNHHIFYAVAEQPLTTQFGSQSNAQ